LNYNYIYNTEATTMGKFILIVCLMVTSASAAKICPIDAPVQRFWLPEDINCDLGMGTPNVTVEFQRINEKWLRTPSALIQVVNLKCTTQSSLFGDGDGTRSEEGIILDKTTAFEVNRTLTYGDIHLDPTSEHQFSNEYISTCVSNLVKEKVTEYTYVTVTRGEMGYRPNDKAIINQMTDASRCDYFKGICTTDSGTKSTLIWTIHEDAEKRFDPSNSIISRANIIIDQNNDTHIIIPDIFTSYVIKQGTAKDADGFYTVSSGIARIKVLPNNDVDTTVEPYSIDILDNRIQYLVDNDALTKSMLYKICLNTNFLNRIALASCVSNPNECAKNWIKNMEFDARIVGSALIVQYCAKVNITSFGPKYNETTNVCYLFIPVTYEQDGIMKSGYYSANTDKIYTMSPINGNCKKMDEILVNGENYLYDPKNGSITKIDNIQHLRLDDTNTPEEFEIIRNIGTNEKDVFIPFEEHYDTDVNNYVTKTTSTTNNNSGGINYVGIIIIVIILVILILILFILFKCCRNKMKYNRNITTQRLGTKTFREEPIYMEIANNLADTGV